MSLEPAEAIRRLSDVNSALPPAIILHGVEPFLVEEALDQIRASVRKRGFEDRKTVHQESGFSWSDFYLDLRSQGSLFAQKTIHEVRVTKALNADATKRLNLYLEDVSDDDLLILVLPAMDKRQLAAKWVKQFEQAGLHIAVPTVPVYKMAVWIKQRLQSRSLRVEAGVVEVLLDNVEGNLLAAAQEIDKLQVLCPDGAVTHETLKLCLADQAKFDAFNLVDVCLKGEHHKATRILERIEQEGTEPVIVLWALVREVRKLASVSSKITAGVSQAEAYKSQQIWRSRESIVGAALRRFSAAQWQDLLGQLAKLDQSIKGQRYDGVGTSWQQLTLFCSQLSGTPQRQIFVA